jgi:transposase
MTKDDALFGYRLQLFAEAARTSVSAACRTFAVHRSTYYAWKRQLDRHGLEMLRPRERRRPQMPNQLAKVVDERIVSFSLAHPGLGPRRVSSKLRREKWGGIVVSPNGVWKVLCRHGLNTPAKRLGLIAGYAAPYEPPRDPVWGAQTRSGPFSGRGWGSDTRLLSSWRVHRVARGRVLSAARAFPARAQGIGPDRRDLFGRLRGGRRERLSALREDRRRARGVHGQRRSRALDAPGLGLVEPPRSRGSRAERLDRRGLLCGAERCDLLLLLL